MFLRGNDRPWWEGPLEQVTQAGADWVSGQVYDQGAPPYPGYYYPDGVPQTPTTVVAQTGPNRADLLTWGLLAVGGVMLARALF